MLIHQWNLIYVDSVNSKLLNTSDEGDQIVSADGTSLLVFGKQASIIKVVDGRI